MPQPWLERLNQAVQYHDLHLVLSEISADSRDATDSLKLVESIDEAIRRIHQEKIRDQDDWDSAQRSYRRFRLQHQGICGWIRRHLPFTRTRKLEKQHTDKVADRKAELLANHLIIARAEMIKEQLLPPDARRLGHSPSEWNERLARNDSIQTIHQFADVITKLGDELVKSREFVNSIDAELSSFEPVKFDNPEDQRRKDSDLNDARNELAELQAEIEEEAKIRKDAISRLGKIVSAELAATDSDYRRLENRVQSLKTATQTVEELQKPCEQLSTSLKSMHRMANELGEIPSRREDLSQQVRRLDHQSRDAGNRLEQANSNHRNYVQKYEFTQHGYDRAKSAFDKANDRYLAHLAETGQLEMPVNDTSSSAVELNRCRAELRSAEAELRTVSAPYQASRSDVEQSERELQRLRRQHDDAIREERQLKNRSHQLKSELESQKNQLTGSIMNSDTISARYLESLRRIARDDLVQKFNTVIPNQDFGISRFAPRLNNDRDLKSSMHQYAQALTHLREVRHALEIDYAAEQARQQALWKNRCVELFGDELAAEIGQHR